MHVMIDIETLGTKQDSVILQIGAVGFAIGGMDPGFYADVTVEDQIKMGRTIDPSTVGWWFDKVSSEARVSVFERRHIDTKPLHTCLEKLNEYIKAYLIDDIHNNTSHDKIWANSPTFDLAIIKHAMESCGIIPCWKYWHEADVRTVKTIDNIINGSQLNTMPKVINSIDHSALDDAKNQALYLNYFLSDPRLKTG